MIDLILKRLLVNKIISDDKETLEDYKYALVIMRLKLLHSITILFLGFSLNCFVESIIFLLLYSILRKYIGGFHAKKSVNCFFLSLLFAIGLFYIINYIYIDAFLLLILIVILLIVCLFVSKNVEKQNLIFLLIILISANLIFYIINTPQFMLTCLYAEVLTLILKKLSFNF
ncbi:MAG: accessory gene regulator B family protein [Bacilli bacterium]